MIVAGAGSVADTATGAWYAGLSDGRRFVTTALVTESPGLPVSAADLVVGAGHAYGLWWWEQLPPKADGTTQWTRHEPGVAPESGPTARAAEELR